MQKKNTPTKSKKSKSKKDPIIDIIDSEDAILVNEVVTAASEVISDMPAKRKGKPPTDKANFYVCPKEFDQEIINYYDTGIMSDNLALMVSKISNKLSFAPNFMNYTFREEMVGDGIIRMFKALMTKKYDRVKGTNPFSYFTRIAFNAFRNRIKREKKMRDAHERYKEEYEIYSANYNTMTKNSRGKNHSY